ncbi:hypothetical protein E1281_36980 [Actinomadura sp. KC345]|uniref:DUF6461 domain-containing protein n=1 Tax=Actinomadura sp. KC345 TaxID=2530371 RepID=UPI001053B10B|nr:DUF6461 domain-containing protein [Actinomadura sp. KC345]TDC41779.1 hypothetical protein E1281_36980 [Actinomadura sp. KC345]
MDIDALWAAAEGWDWLQDHDHLQVAGCWTFVRDRTPAQAIAAFGMDPATARMLTLDDGVNAFSGRVDQEGNILPWARFGAFGEWTFALESASYLGHKRDGVGRSLFIGTQAAIVWWSPEDCEVGFSEDGRGVVAFEPCMEWSLVGTDPDRFAPQMRELGILPCPDDWHIADRPSRVVHMLAFLTAIADIRLPGDVALGPLLTCGVPAPP